jgi:hypothetical protein
MTKKEILWREILFQAIENKKIKFIQKDLAKKFGFSLSTVFNALRIPRSLGAIEVKSRGFFIRDKEKFLYLWATFRNLKKDIIYKTQSNFSVFKIEANMPPKIIYGAFSAFLKKFNEAPADYDKVYVYADKKDLREIKKRFPFQKGYENLIVLEKDPYLPKYGKIISSVQIFVDLWNLSEWYAKDFLNNLKEKLNL